MSLLIASLANRLLGNRVSGREEAIGLDLSQHGEAAYSFTTAPTATTRAVAPVPGQGAPVDRMPGEIRAEGTRADRARAQAR